MPYYRLSTFRNPTFQQVPFICHIYLKLFTKNHIYLDASKLKAFEDYKINVAQILEIVFWRVEKEKMVVISIFSFTHNIFIRLLPQTPFLMSLRKEAFEKNGKWHFHLFVQCFLPIYGQLLLYEKKAFICLSLQYSTTHILLLTKL